MYILVSGMWVSGWPLEFYQGPWFYLPQEPWVAWDCDFLPWRSMGERVLPSGLEELEQLLWIWTVSVVDTFHTLIYTLASACLAAPFACGTAQSMIGICNTTTSWLVMWCCDWAGTNRFCYGLDNKAWVDTVNVGFCCCENSPCTKWDVITIPSGTFQVKPHSQAMEWSLASIPTLVPRSGKQVPDSGAKRCK